MTRPFRILLFVAMAAIVVVVLFTVVFPWVDRTFVTDPVIDSAAAAL